VITKGHVIHKHFALAEAETPTGATRDKDIRGHANLFMFFINPAQLLWVIVEDRENGRPARYDFNG